MFIIITYLLEKAWALVKTYPKMFGVLVLGALGGWFLFTLFHKPDPTHAGANITAADVRAAKKEIAHLNTENEARKDSIKVLKAALKADSTHIKGLKETLVVTQTKIEQQTKYIKTIDSKYEKLNAIDNATDAQLYERLSNTRIHTQTDTN